MKNLLVIFLLLLAIGAGYLLLINSPSYRSASKPIPTAGPTPTPIVLDPGKLFNLVNEYRVNHNLNKLTLNKDLCPLANERLAQIHNDFTHNQFRALRYRYFPDGEVGENLAEGYNSEKEAMNAWLASPTHHELIVKPNYTSSCLVTDTVNGTYAVQIFSNF